MRTAHTVCCFGMVIVAIFAGECKKSYSLRQKVPLAEEKQGDPPPAGPDAATCENNDQETAVDIIALPAEPESECALGSAVVYQTQEGVGLWYGRGFNGKRTASGERFNMNDFTAAHRTLPFGTKVRVTNLENGKCIIVTINDRGPFDKHAIIDLSYTAARQIGMAAEGRAKVRLEVFE